MPVKVSRDPWTRQGGKHPAPYSKGIAKDGDDYIVSGNRMLGDLHTAYRVRLGAGVLKQVCEPAWHAMIAHALHRACLDERLLTTVYQHLSAIGPDGVKESSKESLPLAGLEEINRILDYRAQASRKEANKALTRAQRAEIRGDLRAAKRYGASRSVAVEHINKEYAGSRRDIDRLADEVFGKDVKDVKDSEDVKDVEDNKDNKVVEDVEDVEGVKTE